jgi:hypothetical protein
LLIGGADYAGHAITLLNYLFSRFSFVARQASVPQRRLAKIGGGRKIFTRYFARLPNAK